MVSSRLFTFLYLFGKYGSLAQDEGKTICRDKPRLIPHQNGLWSGSFPETNNLNIALCEGNITVNDDGSVCVTGRVSYEQLAEAVNYAMYAPASETISVTGHLISGTGNVVLGAKAGYLYDFVSSYIVNGTTYTADDTITDNLLAASKGTVDGVCFDESFFEAESWYQTRHTSWQTSSVTGSDLSDANLIFMGRTTTTAEFHSEADEPGVFMETIYTIRMWLFKITAGFPTPQFVFSLVPVFPFTGLLRQNIVGRGVFSTNRYPQPLTAPNAYVEDIQIDAPWENYLEVMDNGVFAEMPAFMGSVVKKLSASDSSIGCWKGNTAAIDLQMPISKSSEIDDWAVNTLYPALSALGDVTLHFGKRLPTGSSLLEGALTKYSTCGVTIDLSPDECYHPACTRSTTITDFDYPAAYFTDVGPFASSDSSDSSD